MFDVILSRNKCRRFIASANKSEMINSLHFKEITDDSWVQRKQQLFLEIYVYCYKIDSITTYKMSITISTSIYTILIYLKIVIRAHYIIQIYFISIGHIIVYWYKCKLYKAFHMISCPRINFVQSASYVSSFFIAAALANRILL